MAKRIGIVTFHRAYNSGAMLQAYALKRVLESRGAEVRFVESGGLQPGAAWPHVGKTLKERMFYPVRLMNMLGIAQIRAHRFERFRASYLPEEIVSLSCQELSRKFDVLVVGSDQVWNPNIGFNAKPVYLLENVQSEIRRVSYAASFGVSELPAELRGRYADAIRKFDLISVREDTGVDIVESLIGVRPDVVLDPTMLLDASDYATVESSRLVEGDYVCCYCPSENSELYRIARQYARSKGMRLVNIQNGRSGWAGCHLEDWRATSPDRFLSLIHHSKCVITDSFHATVFSILFGKPFVTISCQAGKGVGSRLETLLKSMNLEAHYIQVSCTMEEIDAVQDFDRVAVLSRLEAIRIPSFKVIDRILL